ncbi:MAG: RecQ family ATP-dependent DNA helicase, partial [Alphaproteobacteria bacterium]|nr:RecQ family ATP-dependent DNA helicase [Alphaproteobacteria bacterium]
MASMDLSTILFLDIETAWDDRVLKVGAVLGATERLWESQTGDPAGLAALLDPLAAQATAVAGHNLLGHDLPRLRAWLPGLAPLRLPALDTLLLSPLAFPSNPYHQLVKDYKLVHDAVNDPVADARLARRLLADEIEALRKQPRGLLSLYGGCFARGVLPDGEAPTAIADLFASLGAPPPPDARRCLALWREHAAGLACEGALERLGAASFSDPGRLPPLAYALAWLRVAGGDSVVPPWVRHRVPRVIELLKALRDKPCAAPGCAYCRAAHDATPLLARHFGFAAYRSDPRAPDGSSLQLRIVEAGLRDEPLLAILPTGGGKSLCFQVPALARYARRGTLTVVISPLQALMKDQVEGLERKTHSTAAAALTGMLTPPERSAVIERVALGGVGLLYLSPEQLRNASTRRALDQREIGCWVFDEAHCLSKWGHDFRPDYLYAVRVIGEINKRAPAPVACYTATAKAEVVAEIVAIFKDSLGQDLTLFEAGVERSNLSFSVREARAADKLASVLELLADHLTPGDARASAVIYCATRRRSEEMAEALARQGWMAGAFHAGLRTADKLAVHDGFAEGTVQVVCATNAFGMGIDKDTVRLVIHAEIPGSLENYLQEAGRAGRDRLPAHCALLYDPKDVDTQFRLGALSELGWKDITQIHRGVRQAARRIGREQVVLTTGELLADDDIDLDDRDGQADTKVKTAVAWLEKAGLLERNANETRVAPGRPMLASMEAFERRAAGLGLAEAVARRWRAIYRKLIAAAADPDEHGLSTDDLTDTTSPDDAGREDAGHRVMKILAEMARHGLIDGGTALTALVKPQALGRMLEQLQAIERAMVALLREATPDGDQVHLSLRLVSQRLRDEGHGEATPEVLRRILKTLDQGERSPHGWISRVRVRPLGQGHFRVAVPGDWREVEAVARRRHILAGRVVETLVEKTRGEHGRIAQAVVRFTIEELARLANDDIELAATLSDPLAAAQSVLVTLHDWKVITLQQGLAIFRQAMTIDVREASRRYTKEDYEPLARHYQERVRQIHVMDEFARRGLRDIGRALGFASDYFHLPTPMFVARHLGGRDTDLSRPLSPEMHSRIVTSLGNPAQQAIVTASADRDLLVLAGPGAGKTRVIVHRAAYLIRVLRVAPRALLVLCFNRSAALSIRRRLRDLIGDEAAHVDVRTYHALAMRLMGASFEGRAEIPDIDTAMAAIIDEAVAMLTGRRAVPGLDPDAVRDQLLSHYRYILIDEYQDIDSGQYDLVSAIAGRTLADADARVSLMAVGDDDQAIYRFRGANVDFIRRFESDYGAKRHYLVENYRSSAAIIAAANALIAVNRDRMKGDQPIRIDRLRAKGPPGEPVRCLMVRDASHQAVAVVAEIRRLQTIEPAIRPADIAVLTPTRHDLHVLRALCERERLPVQMAGDERKIPLRRLREVWALLDFVGRAA